MDTMDAMDDGLDGREPILRVLLAIAAASLAGLAVCAVGWYRAATATADLEDLSPEERQLLVKEIVELAPGIHRRAWFEPAIGYTLRPGAEIDAWGDRFTSNELGYRSPPAAKAPGTFRVVFVGDSWTYGMGIRGEESFPRVVARLANRHGGQERPVEAWTLALPGYNAWNYTAALGYFFERLEPDAVVLCPSGNDNHSTPGILPDGSVAQAVVDRDRFGDPHAVTYRTRRLDSYRFRERWRQSFAALRQAELRLERLGVPVLHFFLARWEPVDVHARVAANRLTAPYLIVPLELTLGRWENPPPLRHGTAVANELYARMVYRGLAHLLDWRPLPEDDERSDVEIFAAPPRDQDWGALFDRLSAAATAKEIPESFRPSPAARLQVAGALDLETGLMGRATTILVRHRPGGRTLRVTVRRLADAASLYPLALTVAIPSPAGGTRTTVTVPASGPVVHRLSLPIPGDLRPGSALDVVLVAERSVTSPRSLAARSLYIESIDTSVEPGRRRSAATAR